MDRQTRKNLKTDKFAEEVGHTFEFLADHRDKVQRYGIVVAVLLILGGAYYFYSRSQATARQDALAAAIRVDDATVGAQQQPPLLNYATAEEKEKARQKAFGDLAAKYHGTQGTIGNLYLAASAVDRGDNATAERLYKDVIASGPAVYASVASVALADVYATQGKNDEAEKLLRQVVANPTTFVSKEEATIHLAEAISTTKPKEARALLEPLRAARSTVSRAAIAALGKLPPNAN